MLFYIIRLFPENQRFVYLAQIYWMPHPLSSIPRCLVNTHPTAVFLDYQEDTIAHILSIATEYRQEAVIGCDRDLGRMDWNLKVLQFYIGLPTWHPTVRYFLCFGVIELDIYYPKSSGFDSKRSSYNWPWIFWKGWRWVSMYQGGCFILQSHRKVVVNGGGSLLYAYYLQMLGESLKDSKPTSNPLAEWTVKLFHLHVFYTPQIKRKTHIAQQSISTFASLSGCDSSKKCQSLGLQVRRFGFFGPACLGYSLPKNAWNMGYAGSGVGR